MKKSPLALASERRATFYPRHDPCSTLAEMIAATKKPGD